MQSNRPLGILLGVFVVLTLIYAWATPPFEASDELWHFGMVDVIADTGALPVQNPGEATPWEQEGSQPPLYYTIVAALVRSIDRSDFDSLRQPNPHTKAGIPGDSDNKNIVLHDTPHPPLERTTLAVYVGRLFSIGLGCVTVFAVYQTTLLLTEQRTIALLAAALTAFNPMFLFISASVNNDNLVTAVNSLVLWQMLAMLRENRFRLWRSVLIALLIALAALSKLSGLVLVPVVALAALWMTFEPLILKKPQSVRLGGLFTLGSLMLLAWAGLAGWWYARNLSLYGELFGTQMMVAVAGPRLEPFTLNTLVAEFEGFRVGYWGWFGAVSIITTDAFYRVMDVVTVLAVIGLGVWFVSYRGKRAFSFQLVAVALLALTIALGSGAVIAWTAQTYASQGRLLFPFIAAISSLMALGLVELLRLIFKHETRRFAAVSLGSISFALFALLVPLVNIAPVYVPPAPLESLPDGVRPVYARFGDVALVAYDTPNQRYNPGDMLPLTVYWQVIDQSERDYSVYLHAVDPAGEVVGRIDTYPGAGTLRTSTWQPGAIYADTYRIPLDEHSAGRFLLRVQVGWWLFGTDTVISAEDEVDSPLESVMLNAGAFVGDEVVQTDSFKHVDNANFGGVITLNGYTLEGDHLRLLWRATGTPPGDYTVFAQVLDQSNTVVGQGDAPPSLPTSYWRSGEAFITEHTLTYPEPLIPGSYRLLVGWYRREDFARLETGAPDNALVLTSIQVE